MESTLKYLHIEWLVNSYFKNDNKHIMVAFQAFNMLN